MLNDVVNVKFLLLIVIIIFIFRHRKKLYLHQLSQVENYDNHSLLSNNFINLNREIDTKKLYSFEKDTLIYTPKLYTNYRYSLEFKLGLEIAKEFQIQNQETPGLSSNLNLITENSRDLFLCSETEYYQMIENNPKLQEKLGFICALYFQHFLFFMSPDSKIENIQDLKIFMNRDNLFNEDKEKNKEVTIKVGIPNKNSNSYQDALKIFNSIGIDINNNKYSNLKFVFDSEKNLLGRIKPTAIESKKIDCLYLTTTEKNPYLLEMLQTYNLNVVSLDNINTNIIKSNYGGNYLFKNSISKNIFSKIIKKKNIYQDIPDYNLSTRLINNDAETLIIGSEYLNVFSSRIIVVASNQVSSRYVEQFLNYLYGDIDNLRNSLQNYLLYPTQKNFLIRCLDPHEMFYVNSKFQYHPGAENFYSKIHFIADDNNLKDNFFNNDK